MRQTITRRLFIKSFIGVAIASGFQSFVGCAFHRANQAWRPFQYAFVTNSDSGDLSVIDVNSKREVKRIGVGERPHYVDISPDGMHALVTNGESDTVTIINVKRLQAIKTLSVDHHPCWIEVRPDNKYAYVGNSAGNTVSVIDMEILEVIANVPTGEHPEWLHTVKTPDGVWRCYAANGRDTTLSQILGPPFQNARTINAGEWPQWATPSLDGRYIFATNHESDSVTIHDAVTGTSLKTVESGEAPDYAVPSPDNNFMLVSCRGDNTVSALDVESHARLANITVGLVPGWISFSADSSRAFVVNESGNSISVIGTTTWDEIKRIHTPSLPIWIEVQDDVIYVVCRNDNSVNLIDPELLEITGKVDVGERPHHLSIYPQAVQFIRS